MSQLIHAVARLRAMESELLTQNSANRMISASSFESAYAVLDELGYAKESSIFRDSYDYEGAIEMGLQETTLVFHSFGLKNKMRILTPIFDIQNIIFCLKKKEELKDTVVESEDISSQENISYVSSDDVISYGYYSIEDLNTVFFDEAHSAHEELNTLVSSLETCETLEEKEVLVEKTIFKLAEKEAGKSVFLKKFLKKIQEINAIKKDILVDSVEDLIERYPEYKNIFSPSFKDLSLQQQLTSLEILLDEDMVAFLKRESLGKIDGYEVPFSFFWRKERNSRVIRSILLAKKSGFSAEFIKSEFNAFIF